MAMADDSMKCKHAAIYFDAAAAVEAMLEALKRGFGENVAAYDRFYGEIVHIPAKRHGQNPEIEAAVVKIEVIRRLGVPARASGRLRLPDGRQGEGERLLWPALPVAQRFEGPCL
jgi:hypothetical protein